MVLEKVWVWYNMGLGMEGIYNECALGIRIGKKRRYGKKRKYGKKMRTRKNKRQKNKRGYKKKSFT